MFCLWHWHDQAQIWHSANVKCPLLNEEERWTAWPFWELTVTATVPSLTLAGRRATGLKTLTFFTSVFLQESVQYDNQQPHEASGHPKCGPYIISIGHC